MAPLRTLIAHGNTSATTELEARLTTLGYGVVASASSTEAAVTLAASINPDLLLLEAALPGEMSVAMAAAAIRLNRAVPIVFIGSEADEATLRQARVGEPYGFLEPPFRDRELRVTLDLALCKHGAARAAHELEGFFAVATDMFCFLDFNGYFKRLNPAWERTLGFSREELMAKRFIEFVHPDDRERTLHQNAEVRGGGQAKGFENRYRCKDGSYRWFLWNASPQPDEGVIYSVARDITARKQAEVERAELIRKLEASLAEVRTLRAILPICSYCKKIRDDQDYWQTVESYISRHTNTRFSHGICPGCMATVVEPQFSEREGA